MKNIINKISFKPLKETDLKLIHRWRLSGHVSKWFKGKLSLEGIKKKYLPRIFGEVPTSCFLILFDKQPIGLIQTFRISDYPKYEKILQVDKNTATFDIFIGESDYLHKGFGTYIFSKFMKKIVFPKFNVDYCIVAPDPKNVIAIKAYQKTGFSYLKTIFNPAQNHKEYIMSITKDAIKK